jgi:hypothetical protein
MHHNLLLTPFAFQGNQNMTVNQILSNKLQQQWNIKHNKQKWQNSFAMQTPYTMLFTTYSSEVGDYACQLTAASTLLSQILVPEDRL